MEKNELLEQVQAICCDVFKKDQIFLNLDMAIENIEGWDSLSHIQFVMALEKHFHIKFALREIMNWKVMSDIIECIKCKA